MKADEIPVTYIQAVSGYKSCDSLSAHSSFLLTIVYVVQVYVYACVTEI